MSERMIPGVVGNKRWNPMVAVRQAIYPSRLNFPERIRERMGESAVLQEPKATVYTDFGIRVLIAVAVMLLLSSNLPAETPQSVKTDAGFDVTLAGKPFASYDFNRFGTPILWPLIGPTGYRMTRDYPMNQEPPKSEKKDHPHHRSLWFNHGEVRYDAGKKTANFWNLSNDLIVHRELLRNDADPKTGVLTVVTTNDWVADGGKTLCRDRRTFRFAEAASGAMRRIDVDIELTAVEEIVFGDTKEGTFGIRVPGSIDVDAKKRNPEWGGTILNARGDKDGAAWGKRAEWVDYSGPVEDAEHGKAIAGMAVLNHPTSFRYPTYWHVRDYGLFAANPFGVHDFENKKEKSGEHSMKPGDTLLFRYRLLLHAGPADSAVLDKAFEDYRKE